MVDRQLYPHPFEKFLLEFSFVKSRMLLVNRGDDCIAKKLVQIADQGESFCRGHAPRNRQLLRVQFSKRGPNIALDYLARQRRRGNRRVTGAQAEIGKRLVDVEDGFLVNGHVGSQ